MGLSDKVIRGILGLVGVIRKTKRFTTGGNADFLSTRSAGEVVLIGPGDQALPNGISAAENGFWAHAFLYIGKEAAEMMRQKYPQILKLRKINPITGADEGQAIPDQACDGEIVEAEGGGIQIDTIAKYSGGQMVGFYRTLNQDQLERLLLWFYSQVGKPYGFLTFITELAPDPSAVPMPIKDPGRICSGYDASGFWNVLGWPLARPEIKPDRASPCDLYNGLEPQLFWSRHFYNCGPSN